MEFNPTTLYGFRYPNDMDPSSTYPRLPGLLNKENSSEMVLDEFARANDLAPRNREFWAQEGLVNEAKNTNSNGRFMALFFFIPQFTRYRKDRLTEFRNLENQFL